jgi:hypothetical protein
MRDPVRQLKHELLAAAERRATPVAVHAGGRRLRPHLGRNRLLLASAALVITVAASLLFTAPWNASPSFIARAEAALRPPPGTVLHQKWVVTTTSTEFGCTVRHRPNEIWIDQTPPHRYRVLLNAPPPPAAGASGRRALACWNGKGPELGGSLDGGETLEFLPPNTLLIAAPACRGCPPPQFGFPVDPVAELRQSLNAGTARDEGKTKLNGHTVERIRIDPEARCGVPGCPRQPFYWYVDPTTFYPVGMEGAGGITSPNRPFLRLHVVVRFLSYEYLPRTPANVALTDIRAQHPSATRP